MKVPRWQGKRIVGPERTDGEGWMRMGEKGEQDRELKFWAEGEGSGVTCYGYVLQCYGGVQNRGMDGVCQ